MSIVAEFKAFILRGNVVDLAIGIIIGAAFGTIVTSLVEDILMPPIGALTGGVDFSDLTIELPGKRIDPSTADKPKAEQKLIPVEIKYGRFVQKMINFLIVAACLFLVIKATNRLKKKDAVAPAEPTPTERLLAEIRDELRTKN